MSVCCNGLVVLPAGAGGVGRTVGISSHTRHPPSQNTPPLSPPTHTAPHPTQRGRAAAAAPPARGAARGPRPLAPRGAVRPAPLRGALPQRRRGGARARRPARVPGRRRGAALRGAGQGRLAIGCFDGPRPRVPVGAAAAGPAARGRQLCEVKGGGDGRDGVAAQGMLCGPDGRRGRRSNGGGQHTPALLPELCRPRPRFPLQPSPNTCSPLAHKHATHTHNAAACAT